MRTAASIVAVLSLVALLAAPATADVYDLYAEYRSTGSVYACRHSTEELRAAVGDVPADINAYDPGFVASLDLALDQRVAGCDALRKAANRHTAAVTAEDGSPGPPSPRHQVRPVVGSAPGRAELTVLFGAAALAVTGSLAAAVGFGGRRERR